MKMLEILLKYLPKNGGWPAGVDYIADNGKGCAFQYRTKGQIAGSPVHYLMRIDSTGMETVTREQYESAFAAKNDNLVWDGEGLPPVGVECEMLWNKEWVKCVIKAYGDEQFIFKAQGHKEWAGHINNFEFRPIRSPEDVARDRAIKDMESVIDALIDRSKSFEAIYHAIAAGKITGVSIAK